LLNNLAICTYTRQIRAAPRGGLHPTTSCTLCTRRPLSTESVLYSRLLAEQEERSGRACSGQNSIAMDSRRSSAEEDTAPDFTAVCSLGEGWGGRWHVCTATQQEIRAPGCIKFRTYMSVSGGCAVCSRCVMPAGETAANRMKY
jgi:hypothetical protein